MQTKTAARWRHSPYSIWLYAYVIGLGLYIGWLDFIPSAAWLDLSFYAAMILNGLIVVVSVIYLKRRQITYRKEIPSWVLRQGFYLLLIFLLYLILWAGLAHGLGAILHQAVGQPAHIEMVVERQHTSQKNCRYQLRAIALQPDHPTYVCISSAQYAAFPAHATPERLSSRKSVFGFTVSEWNILSTSGK